MAPIRLIESRTAMTSSDLDPEAGHGDMDTFSIPDSDTSTVRKPSINKGANLSDEKSSSFLIAPKAARTLGWGDRQESQKLVKDKKIFKPLVLLLIALMLVYNFFQVCVSFSIKMLDLPSIITRRPSKEHITDKTTVYVPSKF